MCVCARTSACVYVCLIDQCSLRASQGNILGGAHVYSAPEKRLLSALVTLHVLIHTRIQFCIDTHGRMHKEPLLNSHTHTRVHTHAPTPSPEWPSRRACLCQQMSGRRCVFLCISLHSFHLLLQRLPICLWPCFISAHSNLLPVRTPASLFYYRHTGVVYYKKKNTTFLPSQCYRNASTQPSSFHLSGIGPEVTSCWSLMRQLCFGLFYSHLFWFCARLIIIIIFFCNTKEEFLQNGVKKGTWQRGIRKTLSPK